MKINKIIILMIMFFTLMFSANAVLTDAKSYYAMENLLDSTPNGINLTNFGATSNLGLIGNGYTFNNNYIDTNSNNLLGTNAFTVNIWIKTTSTTAGSLLSNYLFNGVNTGLALGINRDSVGANTPNTIYAGIGNTFFYSVPALINDNKWHMITYNFDGTIIKIYVDNVLKGTSGIINNPVYIDNNNFVIGKRQFNTGDTFYIGSIDELGIYNRVLTINEINQLYNSGLGFNPYSIVTPIINADNLSIYTTPQVNLTLTTTPLQNTNMSYVLNNNPEIQICSNCNSSTLNLSFTTNGIKTLTLISTDNLGQVNNTFNFTINVPIPSLSYNSFPRYYNQNVYNNSINATSNTNITLEEWELINNNISGLTAYFGTNTNVVRDEVRNLDNIGNINTISTRDISSLSGLDFATTPSGNAIETPLLNISKTKPFSVSFWINPLNDTQGLQTIMQHGAVLSDMFGISLRYGQIRAGIYNGANYNSKMGDILTNRWTFITITYDGTNLHLYRDGIDQTTIGAPVVNGASGFTIGARNLAKDYKFNGYLDEIRIYNKVLNTTEISQLQTFIPATLLNTSLLCSNCVSTNLSINNLTDNDYIFNLLSITSFGVKEYGNVMTIDTIKPIIFNNIGSEINSNSNINFNSFCTDINLNFCDISINNQVQPLNINSFNFTSNGNFSYIINAQDLAGNNINQSGTVFINPYFNINFLQSNGSDILNYTIDNILFNNPTSLLYSTLLNKNNITFSKLGYVDTDINYDINQLNPFNSNYTINQSQINLNIYNADTKQLLTGTTDIILIAGKGWTGSTTTGQATIKDFNFVSGDYQIIVNHNSFKSETLYFTYDNRKNINKNVYLLNATGVNTGYVTMVASTDTGQFISGAICNALEWNSNSSAYVSVAEGLTNSFGQTKLNIHLNIDSYKFQCSKNGQSSESQTQIVQTNGLTIPLVLSQATNAKPYSLGGVSFKFTFVNSSTTNKLLSFDYTDSKNLVTTACIDVYKVQGITQTLLNQTCINSSTAKIFLDINTNTSYTINAIAKVQDSSGSFQTLKKIVFSGSDSFEGVLKQYHLDIVIPLVLTIVGIIIGLSLNPQNIFISAISSIIMVWISVLLVPSTISSTIAVFISFICILIIYGGQKR